MNAACSECQGSHDMPIECEVDGEAARDAVSSPAGQERVSVDTAGVRHPCPLARQTAGQPESPPSGSRLNAIDNE